MSHTSAPWTSSARPTATKPRSPWSWWYGCLLPPRSDTAPPQEPSRIPMDLAHSAPSCSRSQPAGTKGLVRTEGQPKMGLRWGHVGDKGGRQAAPTLLQIHGHCPEKHSQGLVFNQCFRVVRGQARLWKWDTTEIKVQKYNPPRQPGASKPELGMARLFLWFDPAGTQPVPIPGVPMLVASAGSWHQAPLPAPSRLGITGARLGFWGGAHRDKGTGKALRAMCPMVGVRRPWPGRAQRGRRCFLVGPIKIELFKMAQKRIP